VAGAHDFAACVEQDIRAIKRGDYLARRRRRYRHAATALDDRGNVQFDARDPAVGAEIGHLPGRLRNV
jgi:hypothetical protein